MSRHCKFKRHWFFDLCSMDLIVAQSASSLKPGAAPRILLKSEIGVPQLAKKLKQHRISSTDLECSKNPNKLLALANGDRVKDRQRSTSSFVVDIEKKQAAGNLLNGLGSFHGPLIRQVSQLGAVVQKYQNSATLSTQDLQSTCNSFVASARQLAKALEVPLVNDLGYIKRYVRCLQCNIAEVVNCMKDLIDYSRQTGTGPMESLNNFPRRNSSGLASSSQAQQQQSPASQNHINQNSSITNGPNSAHMTPNQITNPNQSDQISNNAPVNPALPTGSGSAPSPYPLVPVKQEIQTQNPNQNQNPIPNQVPTPNSNPNQMASPLPSTSNNNSSMMPPTAPVQTRVTDADDSQSSVQRILQEMMMSSQLNGVAPMGNTEMKPSVNGVMPLNGYGSNMMGGPSPGPGSSGMRTSMSSGAMVMNGRVRMTQSHDPTVMTHGNNHQQEMGGQMMGELRAVNSFNNLYDWKPNQ